MNDYYWVKNPYIVLQPHLFVLASFYPDATPVFNVRIKKSGTRPVDFSSLDFTSPLIICQHSFKTLFHNFIKMAHASNRLLLYATCIQNLQNKFVSHKSIQKVLFHQLEPQINPSDFNSSLPHVNIHLKYYFTILSTRHKEIYL